MASELKYYREWAFKYKFEYQVLASTNFKSLSNRLGGKKARKGSLGLPQNNSSVVEFKKEGKDIQYFSFNFPTPQLSTSAKATTSDNNNNYYFSQFINNYLFWW